MVDLELEPSLSESEASGLNYYFTWASTSNSKIPLSKYAVNFQASVPLLVMLGCSPLLSSVRSSYTSFILQKAVHMLLPPGASRELSLSSHWCSHNTFHMFYFSTIISPQIVIKYLICARRWVRCWESTVSKLVIKKGITPKH